MVFPGGFYMLLRGFTTLCFILTAFLLASDHERIWPCGEEQD